MQNHQLINQTSGKQEWYTPPGIVEIARETMGGIDLDPASSEKANDLIVNATRYHTRPERAHKIPPNKNIKHRYIIDNSGLDYQWHGRIWLNPPYGNPIKKCDQDCERPSCKKRGYHLATDRPGIEHWINHLVSDYDAGHIEQAMTIVFSSVNAKWFEPLKRFPRFEFSRRVNFLAADTLKPVGGVSRDSVLIYLPERTNSTRAHRAFTAALKASPYTGAMMLPYLRIR